VNSWSLTSIDKLSLTTSSTSPVLRQHDEDSSVKDVAPGRERTRIQGSGGTAPDIATGGLRQPSSGQIPHAGTVRNDALVRKFFPVVSLLCNVGALVAVSRKDWQHGVLLGCPRYKHRLRRVVVAR